MKRLTELIGPTLAILLVVIMVGAALDNMNNAYTIKVTYANGQVEHLPYAKIVQVIGNRVVANESRIEIDNSNPFCISADYELNMPDNFEWQHVPTTKKVCFGYNKKSYQVVDISGGP